MSTDDKSRKTEQPTPHKLKQARKKGQVAQSKDVASTVSIIFLFLFLWGIWDYGWQLIEVYTANAFSSASLDFESSTNFLSHHGASIYFIIVMPAVVLAALTAIFGYVIQFGLVFSADPITPKAEKINPISGFKRIFGPKNLMETVKAIVKITLFVTCLYIIIYFMSPDLMQSAHCGLICTTELVKYIFMWVNLAAVLIFLTTALFDYWFQRKIFIKDQMMTKDEVKRDQKDTEGDPHIKGRRKTIQQEDMEYNIKQRLTELTVLVASSSIAVGLKYVEGETPLPLITIIEKEESAAVIVSACRHLEVPIFVDEELANTLAKKGELNQYIPSSSIQDIAKIFAEILET